MERLLCTVGGLDHYEVLTTNGKRPDCLFGIIVIHRDSAVRLKYTKIIFLIYAVSESFSDCAVVSYL